MSSKATYLLVGTLFFYSVLTSSATAQLSVDAREVIKRGIATRQSLDSHHPSQVLEVEIEAGGGLAYRAYRPQHENLKHMVLVVDEPTERGGTDTGPSPLAYFVVGVGACLLNQFVRLAVAEDIDLVFSRMNLRGRFRQEVGGAFESITHEVHANGIATSAEVRNLAEKVNDYCYIHTTLREVIALTTVIHVNGIEAARIESTPSR